MNDVSSSDNTTQAATAGAKNALQQASHWSAAQWWGMIKTSFAAWVDDYAPSMGAALAYYTVFSLAPLLVIVISVAGLIFGPDAVRGAIFSEINGLMGAGAAIAIQDLLGSVSKPSTGILGSIFGIVVLLIGATSVFGELQNALDRIWRAPARVRSSGLLTLLQTRILSFGMILGIAFLLMVSLVTGAAIAALGKWWGGWFAGWEVLAQIINASVGFLMTTTVFALIYKLMPRVKVGWGDVWVGAAVTAMLFTIGRLLISLYIGKTGVASGFGAAGSVAVIFVWVYYSAQVFLIGAEFTWVYAKRMGSQQHLTKPTKQELLGAADIPQLSAEYQPPTVNEASIDAEGGSVIFDSNASASDAPKTTASNALPLALAGLASLVALTLIVGRSRPLLSGATHSKVRDGS
jgi:membrane protein